MAALKKCSHFSLISCFLCLLKYLYGVVYGGDWYRSPHIEQSYVEDEC